MPALLSMAVAMLATPLLTLAYATAAEPFRPVLRRRRIVVPSSWPALSILHLSDLHIRTGADRLWHAQAGLLRGLEPDVVVVTGDICETVNDVKRAVELLSLVRPRFGMFAVLGNHEHGAHRPRPQHGAASLVWSRLLDRLLKGLVREPERQPGQALAIAQQLTDAHVEVLVNRGTRLPVRSRTVWIAGADSAWAGRADVAASMAGRRPGEATLALVHEPELTFGAQALGADLILAGHTHGGQVRLPLIGAPYSHRVDARIQIASGFQRIGHSLLHISRGLGHTIPLRLGCPPEAVWLDCAPHADSAASGRGSSAQRAACIR